MIMQTTAPAITIGGLSSRASSDPAARRDRAPRATEQRALPRLGGALGALLLLGGAVASAACGNSADGAGGGTHVIGDACATSADCESGLFCSTDDPGGQCLKGCQTEADCPAGSVCTDEMKCYRSCTSAADCTRAGYACVEAMTVTSAPTTTCDIAPGS